ncbi:hypothetical protein [Aureispira sp. CCB-E]|uniref:hypothetical protein n=1 Tax=Aureispira sp. CCB-E TaxID=3051121 RepID=UPI002868D2D6|nr:hypothetical protein [Aureispira sp. CCB-E]WMX16572.1 hypothetical protein QP953_09350 [Aureispira sp. CCB-E]
MKYDYLEKMKAKERLSDNEIKKLIRYAIYETDLSSNGDFLKPCLVQIGVKDVSAKIYEYYKNGTIREKIGALKLWYWVREDVDYFCTKRKKLIKNKHAIKNNKTEYVNRLELLKSDFKKCNDVLLKFFFQWAIFTERDSSLFEGLPETVPELKGYLIEKKAMDSLRILNIMFPNLAAEF